MRPSPNSTTSHHTFNASAAALGIKFMASPSRGLPTVQPSASQQIRPVFMPASERESLVTFSHCNASDTCGGVYQKCTNDAVKNLNSFERSRTSSWEAVSGLSCLSRAAAASKRLAATPRARAATIFPARRRGAQLWPSKHNPGPKVPHYERAPR